MSSDQVLGLVREEFRRLGQLLRQDVGKEIRKEIEPTLQSLEEKGTVKPKELPVTAWHTEESEAPPTWRVALKGHSALKLNEEFALVEKNALKWKSAALNKNASPEIENSQVTPERDVAVMTLPGSVVDVKDVEGETEEDLGTLVRERSQAWNASFNYHAAEKARHGKQLGPRTIKSDDPVRASWFYQKVEEVVCSQRFEITVMIMIFFNALLVGAQTQYMAVAVIDEPPLPYRVYDLFYLGCCCLEVGARMYVYRLEFFFMWGWQWNLFDLLLVAGQLFEEGLMLVLKELNTENDALSTSLSLLSIVRMLRALRVVRVLKVLQHAQDLRLIVSCIAYSIRPLFWSMVVIIMMTYIVGLYFTQLVTGMRTEHDTMQVIYSDEDELVYQQLEILFGNLYKSTLTLFQGISGGHDWDTVVRPVLDLISPWAALLLVLYISFAILAVMNVVTGLFVESAMERAQEVRQSTLVAKIRRVFASLDLDTSGCISSSEFEAHAEDPVVADYFQAMDIAPSEAKCVFSMLDSDGSGIIDFEEFMHGCLRLQGPARAADLVLSSMENRGAFDSIHAKLRKMESRLTEIAHKV